MNREDNPKLGKRTYHGGLAGNKDAFHCPAILVTSNEKLRPGAPLVFVDDDLMEVKLSTHRARTCIADPFLREDIPVGQTFWALLDPSLAKGLTHQFDVDLSNLDPDSTEDDDDWCKRDCNE